MCIIFFLLGTVFPGYDLRKCSCRTFASTVQKYASSALYLLLFRIYSVHVFVARPLLDPRSFCCNDRRQNSKPFWAL
jgi:hypothetical protein